MYFKQKLMVIWIKNKSPIVFIAWIKLYCLSLFKTLGNIKYKNKQRDKYHATAFKEKYMLVLGNQSCINRILEKILNIS